MKNETDCLIPDDAEMIQSLSSMELVGEQRCQNKNRIPGLTYPYQGLEFLEIKFSQIPLPKFFRDITQRTEWIDEFTQSVSKRIILNDEIFFNE
ncbi:MAG: hypothetical protein EZS28_053624, partial [Streblomastix strix]